LTIYSEGLRPFLFRFDAEKAHDLAKFSLRTSWPWRALSLHSADARLNVAVGGLDLPNPICLSPGFDKNAEALAGLQHLGFGAVTVGSILPVARTGNPRPRLLRYPAEEALGNCYGLPSDGVDRCAPRLARFRKRGLRSRVVANIDASSVDLYLRSFGLIEPHVDAVELGLQCPNNTEDHGEFHDPAVFEALLGSIMRRRTRPVFIKLAYPQSEADMQNRLDLAQRAVRLGVDGINVPGIFKRTEPGVSLGVATISGKPAFARTLTIVRRLSEATKGRIAIRANGGITTGEDALQVMMAGASSIDILSAFVFRGWTAAADINRELLQSMEREGVRSLQSLQSKPARSSVHVNSAQAGAVA
jgi:dihydroorotate dehydrogenase